MRKRRHARRVSAIALTAGLACASLAAPVAAAPQPEPLPLGADVPSSASGIAAPRSSEKVGRQSYLLKLNVRSTMKAYTAAGEGLAGRRAARAQGNTVEALQEQVIADLPARTPVLFKTHAVLSGVGVRTNPANLAALAQIPGVAAVYPIAPKKPSLTTSIPLQGGPSAWAGAGTGNGVKVAIIDSGIDYTHADFGGLGTPQAFEDAKAITDDTWKTAKVADGYDFVGDDYDAASDDPTINTPVPDENPLDCMGHGTHVAGITAGQGVVKADGSAYTGPYDQSTDFDALRVGPGMAPEATLFAYRVFGCEGSSDVIVEAIDRALDPNGDSDPSDRVDVINMSLGSDFGTPQDADSVATNAAVDAGVVVVASAGNGFDVTDIAGSPGNARKAISVANSVDGQSILDGGQVTIDGTPQTYGVTRAIRYDWGTLPDLSGAVVESPASNPDACAPYAGADINTVKDKVVLVTWTQDALECGSITRGANLAAAGADGFILANSEETFNGGINGDATIPGVLMVKSGADAIRAALAASKPVTADSTSTNSVVQDFPENTDKVSGSSSRGIHAAGNLKPDIAAVGDTVFSAAVGTGNDGLSETGTSMAAPTVAGLAALVVQAHPTWSPEQVKSAIMNTATDLSTGGNGLGDLYAPIRVGAGRIQAELAVDSEVTAYVADDPGAVSVGFGPVEVNGPMTLTKTVNVTNHGATSQTYAASYDAITGVAGISFTVSPSSITVAPGATEQVAVTFRAASRAAVNNTVDPTIGRYSVADGPRSSMAEASGRLLLTPASGTQLRVPVYAAPRPVSSLTGGSQVALDPVTQDATVTLSGAGLGFGANGTLDDPVSGITSIGAAFELAASDPPAAQCTSPSQGGCWRQPIERSADIRRVGVMAGEEMAYFAIGVDQPWNAPSALTELDVLIDADGDDLEDFALYTTRLTDTDVMVAALYDYAADEVTDLQYLNALPGTVDTAIYDSDTVILPLNLAALASAGIDLDNPDVSYAVVGWSEYASLPIDVAGISNTGDFTLMADLFHPGLRVADGNGASIYPETAGTALQVTRDPQIYGDNDSQGLMLVHLHNAVGAKSEVLAVTDAAGATTTTLATSADTIEVNKPVTLNVSVAGVMAAPTGTVQAVAADTGVVLATGTLNGAGIASLTYTPTSTGTVNLVARYLGDGANLPSTSAQRTLTVTAAPVPGATTTSLTVAPQRVVRGGKVTLEVAVGSPSGTPTGAVSVVDVSTGQVVASGALNGGKGTFGYTPRTPDLMTLQAVFAGDSAFAGSRSVFKRLSVRPADADVSLKVSPKSGEPKDKLTATIKVAKVNGIVATGKVQLTDRGEVVGKAKLNKGKAKITYRPTDSGKHVLRAVYPGDSTYRSGKSAKVSYEVG